MRLCLENKVILLYLPPHSSHVLQPLDLSIFAAMKALYHKALRRISKGDLSRVTKAQFIAIYFEVRPQAMSKRNIESGWRKSGIYPLNVDEPLKTPFVKEQIAIRGDSTVQTPTKTAERVREESVELEERDTRTIIRDLQKQIRELEAKNTLLAT